MKERISAIDSERIKRGLSIQQLADLSMLSNATVSRTLSGKTEPTANTLLSMEAALGIGMESPLNQDPIAPKLDSDPFLRYYFELQEGRIAQQRAHYNMLLAEKNRWIKFLFIVLLLLMCFILALLIYDLLNPAIGYARLTQ